MALTQVDQGLLGTYAQYTGFKNRIINGAMMIDQRNAGASVNTSNTNVFPLDRFQVRVATGSGGTAARSTTSPAGFVNSLLTTIGTGASPVSSDLNYVFQAIEGLNIADLGWGTANAQAISVSFVVRSSVTGTFCVSVANAGLNRSYVATYTINSANTFETKTVTIPGDTSGTWATDNSIGLYLLFDLGCGSARQGTAGSWAGSWAVGTASSVKLCATSGATFYITGVQLEKGSTATSFDYRPYGTELALCQRYFYKTCDPSIQVTSADSNGNIVFTASSTVMYIFHPYKQVMRGTPTVTFYSVVTPGGNYWNNFSNNSTLTTTAEAIGYGGVRIKTETNIDGQRYGGQLTASAEL